jgi:hypothetical protein
MLIKLMPLALCGFGASWIEVMRRGPKSSAASYASIPVFTAPESDRPE